MVIEFIAEFALRWRKKKTGVKRPTAHEYGPDIELHLVPHLGVLKMHGLHASHAPGIFNWIVSDNAPLGAPRPRRRTGRCTTHSSSPTAETGW